MRLADAVAQVSDPFVLKSDGEFALLEQCTRVRGQSALTYVENEKFLRDLENEWISCVICRPEMEDRIPGHISGVVSSPVPKSVFYHIHNNMVQQRKKTPTCIAPSARISESAVIAPYNVTIGENMEIHPQVVIRENVTILDYVTINAGTVVGGQSFTAIKDAEGGVYLALDGGQVVIEEGVDICGPSHVACGILENDVTLIGAGSKIDAMVHIGHGAVIGKRTLVTAGSVISGNCVIGDDAWVGVNATISNRIEIGNHGRVSLGSVVTTNVAEGETVTGNFAIPHAAFLRNLKASLTLPSQSMENNSSGGGDRVTKSLFYQASSFRIPLHTVRKEAA